MLIRFHFVLPPSAQRFVNRHERCGGSRLAGRETILCFEQRALRVEHAEKICRATFVALMRKICGLLAGLGGCFQEMLPCLFLAVVHQRIFGFLQRAEHSAFIEG